MTTSPTATAGRPLPLAALHRRLGARFAPLEELGPAGPAVPSSYGSLAEEIAALRSGCGLADRSWVGRLELTGADRVRFLNNQVTCDLKALAPGESAYGFFTSPQGKILADVTVLVHEDRLWLELPPGLEGTIGDHLRRYVVADSVEVLSLGDMLPIALLGPRAGELIAALAPASASLDRPGRHTRLALHGTEVALERREMPGGEGWIVWVSASIARFLVEDLLTARGDLEPRPVGFEALETVRVEAGFPRFGVDYSLAGPDTFPQETGLDERAVSYTKGCYLGQEVVARIHYRGGVNRMLRGLLFSTEGDKPPARGTKLLLEDREVGVVGSVLHSPTLGRLLGLAILHRRGAEPGTVLALAGGGQAEVREPGLAHSAPGGA